jgi:rare lipoprotein A
VAFGWITRAGALCAGAMLLANCNGIASKVDPKYGVSASPRVVAFGETVPKGGGTYRVGKPYVVAGRTYVPQEDPNYSEQGLASWYGDEFHGRRTANGEIFDMESITAAHPTLPIPSYVRVTNIANRRSLIVRINDRGPYHGNRVIDLSVRAAKLLNFHANGIAKVQVQYVGRAPLEGTDDRMLAATLREGEAAPAPNTMMASAGPLHSTTAMTRARGPVPVPGGRPYTLGEPQAEMPDDTTEPAPRRQLAAAPSRTMNSQIETAELPPTPAATRTVGPRYEMASAKPAAKPYAVRPNAQTSVEVAAAAAPTGFDARWQQSVPASGSLASPTATFAPAGNSAPSPVSAYAPRQDGAYMSGRGLY